jgi:DNA-binding transcriptional LysR family regulator
MDWDKLRIFYTVAQAQSFTRAGEMLNLSQSATSRQISALEESLQVPLFHRHARGLLLTEQGEILYRTVADIFSKLAATENALLESRDRPKGPLKITAPSALGTNWLTPHMSEFCQLYPDINITMILDDRELDLTMREADVAIRLYPAKQPDLIQKQLITLESSVYASNDYLRVHGVPKRAEDLDNHRIVIYGEDTRLPFANVNWLAKEGQTPQSERRSLFRINSLTGILRAVEAGIGIGSLPDYMVQGRKNISRILDELKGPPTEVYFLYPTELRHSKRVKVFREFIIRKIGDSQFKDYVANP